MLQLLLYLGILLTVFGVVSLIQLSRIYTKYHDMYPWFDSEQPWKTGYYLSFFGLAVLVLYVLFVEGVFTQTMSVIDSVVILVLLFGSVVLAHISFDRYKEYFVLRARDKEAGD